MISTHVLDLMSGKPAAGVLVVLARLDDHAWTIVGKARTNRDGRVKSVAGTKRLSKGIYELSFETGAYFQKKKTKAFHPWVTITVHVDSASDYHVPLLLSPFGYSTYRGS